MFFDGVPMAAPDAMYHLKMRADTDTHPNKVDLGPGVYRNEQGLCHELKALREYEVNTGNTNYLNNAARIVLGKDAKILEFNQVASVQTISGTGAVHLGAMLLAHSVPRMSKTVYVGIPAWGNYQPMFKLAGFDVRTYRHYDKSTGTVDWDAVLQAVESAPRGSIFILQACCHNPTAADLSEEQWQILAREIKERGLFPFFDIAYQGMGKGLEEDAYSVRHFAEVGLEMLICQSFSKNLGLYGERVGALHAVCKSSQAAAAVRDQLRFLIRATYSASVVDVVTSFCLHDL
ncbi:PLP-dependent transferase [Clathrospora elynae]|uniref:Aspartate aminotransferase n=1 Tax=Clathrospora elynae TaxID=706981 RepID=A0A6A5S1P9_9PLEO|nr:PLP-dependent transferase [Clathrospora elynae]